MNTIFAVAIFGVFLFFSVIFLVQLWGQNEISPEQYHQVADILRRYPDLAKYLSKFDDHSTIMLSEYKTILKEAKNRKEHLEVLSQIKNRRKLINDGCINYSHLYFIIVSGTVCSRPTIISSSNQ